MRFIYSFIIILFLICIISLCQSVSLSYASDETGSIGNAVSLNGTVIKWFPDQDMVVAYEGVTAVYKDFTITADSAQANLNTNIAMFEGNVKLDNKQNIIEGRRLTLDLKTKEWSFENAKTEILPVAFQNRISSPAFIKGDEVDGNNEELKLKSGTLTTCDLPNPHYYFNVKKMDFYPDRKIIARNVSLFGLGKRLFSLGTLLVPIKGVGTTIIPQIGSSAEEGNFLKTSYAYMANDNHTGIVKLDLMQKRGIGTGIDHTYHINAGDGKLSLYYLRDQEIGGNNITGNYQHQMKIGTVNMNFNANYRTNSYLYYPSSTSRDWQVTMNQNKVNSNTALSFQNSSSSGIGDNKTFTSSLRQMSQFSKKLTGIFSVDMRSYNSTGMSAADRELESSIELRHHIDAFDLSLNANRRTDLDGSDYTGDNFYSSIDRLPELTVDTDSYRLGNRTILGLPCRLSVSVGRFHEMPGGVTSDRYMLRLDILDKSVDLSDRNELNISGGFRQSYYASNMAQYMMRFNSVLTTRYNDYLKSRVTWSYQKPDGYSPFRFDYSSKYNYTRAILDYQNSRKLRWSLSSGYQFDNDNYPWQDLAFRITAHPDSRYAYSLSSGYNFNQGRWRTLVSLFQVTIPKKVLMDVGTRYDLETGKLGIARGRFDIYAGKKWRLEGITSWNGSTKKFDYKAFRLTRDLHCWEASISYNDESGFRNDRSINFDLRIKALPRADRFGIGQYGQSVDTNMGEYNY